MPVDTGTYYLFTVKGVGATLGPERNNHVGAPVSHKAHLFIQFLFRISLSLVAIASSFHFLLDHRLASRRLRTNRTPSCDPFCSPLAPIPLLFPHIWTTMISLAAAGR